MKVYFTEAAYQQLEETHKHLSQKNSQAASQWVNRVTARAKQIGTFPRAGRAGARV